MRPNLVVALLCLGVAAPAGADTLYRYVDEQGVIHFSNQPNDPRYVAVRHFGSGGSLWRPQPSRRSAWRPRNITAYDDLIAGEAQRNGLPPALVKAVIAAESSFDPGAVSHKGAQGLMQLMPQTAAQLGVDDPLEPASNVRGGAGYLRAMIDRYGDLSRALAAYNAGPTAVDRYGGVPPYRETRDYVDRVLTYYRSYHVDFAR